MLRTLLAEQDPASLSRLKRWLRRHPDVVVVAEAASTDQVIEQVASRPIDLIVVDVDLPPAGGFELLASIPGSGRPAVVFHSHSAHHAAQAFAVGAADFLLEPLDRARLESALQRARDLDRGSQNGPVAQPPPLPPLPDSGRVQIVARTPGRVTLLEIDGIEWIEADGNSVVVHGATGSHRLRQTLSDLGHELGPAFARIHRSHVVHLSSIREVQINRDGVYRVLLGSGQDLPVGRLYRGVVRSWLRQARHSAPAGGASPARSVRGLPSSASLCLNRPVHDLPRDPPQRSGRRSERRSGAAP